MPSTNYAWYFPSYADDSIVYSDMFMTVTTIEATLYARVANWMSGLYHGDARVFKAFKFNIAITNFAYNPDSTATPAMSFTSYFTAKHLIDSGGLSIHPYHTVRLVQFFDAAINSYMLSNRAIFSCLVIIKTPATTTSCSDYLTAIAKE